MGLDPPYRDQNHGAYSDFFSFSARLTSRRTLAQPQGARKPVLLQGAIPHLLEHFLDLEKPKLLFLRTLVFPERVLQVNSR